ncbi:hypothetical protein SM033_00237 [Vibrio phage vB_VpaM_sm033]|nr:hypothetical protein SM033_00237 [Vibrio phage vB_VpaM_sm033]
MNTAFNRVATQLGGLHFAVGSPTAMTAALLINEKLPLIPINDQYEFIKRWGSDIFAKAQAEVQRFGAEHMIDETLTLEMTRQIYKQRALIAADPLYILFHMMSPANFEESFMDDPLTAGGEHVLNTAYYYIIEVVHSNRAEMQKTFNEFNYASSNTRLLNMTVDKIYDVFDRDFREVPASTMAGYHRLIKSILSEMFELYRANYNFYKIQESRYAKLVSNQVETALQGTYTQQDMAAFVNTFYNKEIEKREYSKDQDEALANGYINEDQYAYPEPDPGFDMESMSHTELEASWEEIDSFMANMAKGADELEERVDAIMKNGANRADAIQLLGLDPIKDKAELNKLPLHRSGTNHEVGMGLLAGLKKVGRNALVAVMRMIEAVLNKVLRFFGSPFGLKPTFTITEADEAAAKWGQTFAKPIHDIIENKKTPIVRDENLVKNVITQAMETMVDTIESLTEHGERIDGFMAKDDFVRLEGAVEEMNANGEKLIKQFNDSVIASGLLTTIVKEVKQEPDFRHVAGEPFESFGRLSALTNVAQAETDIKAMATGRVEQRVPKVEDIHSVMKDFKDVDHYEDIRLEIRDKAQSAIRRMRGLRTQQFDFLNARPTDRFSVEYMGAKSFKTQVDAVRDMAYTIKGIADIYGVVTSELASMIVTYNANFGDKK